MNKSNKIIVISIISILLIVMISVIASSEAKKGRSAIFEKISSKIKGENKSIENKNLDDVAMSNDTYYQEQAKQANLSKNYNNGLKFSEKCLELNRDNEDCWMHKAYAFYKLNDCTAASVAMYHVLMNWPNDEQALSISQQIYNSPECSELKESLKQISSDSKTSYNQVMGQKLVYISPTIYKNIYEGQVVEWKAKISSYYSQITGIKFCVIDNDHQNVDIDKPCDWFWAYSDAVMSADNLEINPGWDGHWVNYILNYYKVSFNENARFYNDIYTIKGIINGIDCGVDDKCIPNIGIISIAK